MRAPPRRSRKRGHSTCEAPGGPAAQGEAIAEAKPTRIVPPRRSSKRGHRRYETQGGVAAQGGETGTTGQALSTDRLSPLAVLVGQIRETYRLRCDYHSAEKRLTLQAKAIGRRCGLPAGCSEDDVLAIPGTAVPALLEARKIPASQRAVIEKALEKMAKGLPVWPWVEAIRGAGALGLAQVIGEAGDLSEYATVSKLWKRFGLAVIDGVRQSKQSDAEKALAHGYCPRRRAVMWNIGECFVKAGGPYREVYDTRKIIEAQRPACGKAINRHVEPGEDAKAPTSCIDKDTGGCRPGHVHNRAKRYMEKRYLADLWAAWRDAAVSGRGGQGRREPSAGLAFPPSFLSAVEGAA